MAGNQAAMLLILWVLAAFAAYASYDIKYICPDECVHNHPIVWQINVTNRGKTNLYLASVSLSNANATVFAKSNQSELTVSVPDAVGSNKSAIVKIGLRDSYFVTLNSTLPEPDEDNIFRYRFCMERRTPLGTWGIAADSINYCYKELHKVQMYECRYHSDCGNNEYCLYKKCIKLQCNYCQYISSHACHDYGCCEDSSCKSNEKCVNNTCLALECKGNESGNPLFIAEHTCSEKPCADNEIIQNSTCVPADCEYDEHIADFSCKKLDCAFNYSYVNHTCQPLYCITGEGIINHSCRNIDTCRTDEIAFQGNCEKLVCGVMMKGEGHECVVNSWLLIEIVLFFAVAVLLFIDYKKYKWLHKKMIVDALLRRARARSKGQR